MKQVGSKSLSVYPYNTNDIFKLLDGFITKYDAHYAITVMIFWTLTIVAVALDGLMPQNSWIPITLQSMKTKINFFQCNLEETFSCKLKCNTALSRNKQLN